MLGDYVVADGHVDTLSRLRPEGRSFARRSERGQADLPRLRAGGVDLQVLALFEPADPLVGSLWQLETLLTEGDSGAPFFLIRNSTDLAAVPDPSRLGVILSLEGGEALAGETVLLRLWYRLGLRALSLTWNRRNGLADGTWEEESRGGLTRKGREVVQEAGRLGILLDLAHLSERGFWDVLELGAGPVFYSHGSCRALVPGPRLLRDSQIKALGAVGGTVGLTFYPPFLSGGEEAGLGDLFRHLDHLLELVGAEVPALGSDFDGIEKTVQELPDASHLRELAPALDRRYPPPVVASFLGGNLLRCLGGVFSKGG